jgi:hypothetical protein
MRRRALTLATALACSVVLLSGAMARRSGAGAEGKAAGADLFGLAKLVKLRVEVPADEYQAMQPPAAAGAPGGPPPPPKPRKPGERESERNLFGVEFPWARGAITARDARSRTSASATPGTPPTWRPPAG